jgi:hypothetical protein
MLSTIDRSIVYPVSADITEHDLNIVSDLWSVEGREVFRGARDPNYEHANVYWLYDPEDLDRVGVAEHKRDNPGDVSVLWHKDTPFATLLQEDGWTESDSLWSRMPEHSYERFLSEGWTTPTAFLERCLRGDTRIVTPEMLIKMPDVHACEKCGHVSLTPFACGTARSLTFPEKEKIWFVDDRMLVYSPPKGGSTVWSRLGFTTPPEPSASSELQEQQPEPPLQEALQPEASPQPQSPAPAPQ